MSWVGFIDLHRGETVGPTGVGDRESWAAKLAGVRSSSLPRGLRVCCDSAVLSASALRHYVSWPRPEAPSPRRLTVLSFSRPLLEWPPRANWCFICGTLEPSHPATADAPAFRRDCVGYPPKFMALVRIRSRTQPPDQLPAGRPRYTTKSPGAASNCRISPPGAYPVAGTGRDPLFYVRSSPSFPTIYSGTLFVGSACASISFSSCFRIQAPSDTSLDPPKTAPNLSVRLQVCRSIFGAALSPAGSIFDDFCPKSRDFAHFFQKTFHFHQFSAELHCCHVECFCFERPFAKFN